MAGFQIGPLTSILNVNVINLFTSNYNTVVLPLAASFPGRTIQIRDFTGGCSARQIPPSGPEFNEFVDMIIIVRSNVDLIDGTRNQVRLSSPYESIQLTSDGGSNWMITQNYKWGIPAFSTWNWFSSDQLNRLGISNAVIQSPSNIRMGQEVGNSYIYFSQTPLCNTILHHRFTFTFDPATTTGGGLCFVIGPNSNLTGSSNYIGYGISGYLGNQSGNLAMSNTVAVRFTPGFSIPVYPGSISRFGTQANGLGINSAGFILACGQGDPYVTSTLQYSTDGGLSYIPTVGGFDRAGNDAAYIASCNIWVTVGADTQAGRTILYTDPNSIVNWNGQTAPGFDITGRGIAYFDAPSESIDGVQVRFLAVGASSNPVNGYYSDDGIRWLPHPQLYFETSANCIATASYFSPSFCVVGGEASGSRNLRFGGGGDTFVGVTGDIPDVRVNGVAVGYNGGLGSFVWVAVGEGNVTLGPGDIPVYTRSVVRTIGVGSSDWTFATSGGFAEAFGVATDPTANTFVAVGSNPGAVSNIQYSTDQGYTWTAGNLTFDVAGYGVAYGSFGGVWVAVGDHGANPTGHIKTSTDGGVTWTDQATPFPGPFYAVTFDYVNLQFIVAGSNAAAALTILRSTDNTGTAWVPAIVSPSGGFHTTGRGLTFVQYAGSNLLFAVGQGNPTPTNSIQRFSVNGGGGLTSLGIQQPGFDLDVAGTYTGNGICVGPDKVVAVGRGSRDRLSIQSASFDQLSNFAPVVNGGGSNMLTVIYSSNFFCYFAGGDTGSESNVQYSVNGLDFFGTGSPGNFPFFPGYCRGLASGTTSGGANLLIGVGLRTAGGPLGTIQYTEGPFSPWFSIQSGGFSGEGRGIAYNGTYWVAVGYDINPLNTIQYSFDGSNWSGLCNVPFLQNGFNPGATGVEWDTTTQRWIITGFNAGPDTPNLLYSSTTTIRVSTADLLSNGNVPTATGTTMPDIDLLSGKLFETNVQYNRNDSNFHFSIRDTVNNSTFTSNTSGIDLSKILGVGDPPAFFGFVSANANGINCRPQIYSWDAFTG